LDWNDSYRDPNLLKTLECYDQTVDFLKNLDLSESELTKAIIGAIGPWTHTCCRRQGFHLPPSDLIQESEEDRQVWRDQVLATKASDFRALQM